jgi:hypothetical protein
VAGSCEHRNGSLGPINDGVCVDQLRDCWLPETNAVEQRH